MAHQRASEWLRTPRITLSAWIGSEEGDEPRFDVNWPCRLRFPVGGNQPGFGASADAEPVSDEHFHRVLTQPGQIPVIVAGAKTAGISMVVRIFGEWSGIATPVGEKIK